MDIACLVTKIQPSVMRQGMSRLAEELSASPELNFINPLNPKLNPIFYLLALLGAYHFLHFSRIRVKSLTLKRLMSHIFIHLVVCLTTGPKILPKRALHIVRSRASSFK